MSMNNTVDLSRRFNYLKAKDKCVNLNKKEMQELVELAKIFSKQFDKKN